MKMYTENNQKSNKAKKHKNDNDESISNRIQWNCEYVSKIILFLGR